VSKNLRPVFTGVLDVYGLVFDYKPLLFLFFVIVLPALAGFSFSLYSTNQTGKFAFNFDPDPDSDPDPEYI
jgi:hypothetical protein